jgi:hypothetical protein
MQLAAAATSCVRRVGRLATVIALLATALGASAQNAKPVRKPVQAASAPSAPAEVPFVNGHRIAPAPAWVMPVDAPVKAAGAVAHGPSYRVLLSDVQTRLDAPGEQQQYVRSRLVATESAALAEVSKAELHFNPAYQTLTLHEAALWRDGVRHDRLQGARIELLRREERLEQSTLTGTQTLLVVLNDVRVGDAVDVAYTLHGANPIFKGRFADNYQLTFGSVADVVHVRVDHPVSRSLRVKGIRADVTPELTRDGERESLRIVRRDVPMVRGEDQVPPWYKVWPSVHISEYGDWNEVAHWADELFADGADLGPELSERIEAWRARGLPRERLAAEVLEAVQDEVRYFSASLGESSHRPKAPARTYAERLGDCKDKVALLNAMLQRLGFDARPALVSLQRNRGMADYLPGHDQFDHVITRLQLDGKVYWLDPTLQKQGRGLDTRGQASYGMTLVVAPQTQALVRIEPPPAASESMEVDQTWDLSDLARAAQFTSIVRLRGMAAESWRNAVAAGGTDRIAENLAGAWARLMPGIKQTAAPQVRDDREANLFEFELRYEVPAFGTYERGTLTVEAPAIENPRHAGGPARGAARDAMAVRPAAPDAPARARDRTAALPVAPAGAAGSERQALQPELAHGGRWQPVHTAARLHAQARRSAARRSGKLPRAHPVGAPPERHHAAPAAARRGAPAGRVHRHRAPRAAPVRFQRRRAARDGGAPGARGGVGHRGAEERGRAVAAGRPCAGQARDRQQHAEPLRRHAGRCRQGAAARRSAERAAVRARHCAAVAWPHR